jgi:hypothetical protein
VDFIEQWTEEHDPMKKAVRNAQPTPSSGGKGRGKKGGEG